ncbi:MAG: oligosaccharide flippase family protein [Chlorobi bacterium]|nr:oligosaccharide flippase family protein [Chlorobiota bacterium]
MKTNHLAQKENFTNFFWRAIQLFGKKGVSFVIFYFASLFLIPKDFGELNYLLAIVSLLLIFCDFGLSTATAKYVAEYKSKDKKLLKKVLPSVTFLVFVFTSMIVLLLLALGKKIIGDYPYIYIFIPYLYLVPIVGVLEGIYRGKKNFKTLSLITIISGLSTILLSYFFIKNYGITGTIISLIVLYIIDGVILFVKQDDKSREFNYQIVKDVANYSIILGVVNLMYYLFIRVDVLILKRFDYILEIGYYEIINRILDLIVIPFILFSQILAPDITREYVKKKMKLIKRKSNSLIIFSLLLIGPVAVILYFLFPYILKLMFAKYYGNEIMQMFNLIIFALPFRVIYNILNHAIAVPTGHGKISMWAMIIGGIINLFLDIIFIKAFGYIGVVYSTLVCFPVAAIIMTILLYKKLNKLLQIDSGEL